MLRRALLLLAAACLAARADTPGWAVSKTPHFEVYAQNGTAGARGLATWMEQLHAFFRGQTGLSVPDTPIRVIAFRSAAEYEPYRVHRPADAYYLSAGVRSYIVLPSASSAGFPLAAHECAHALLHASGLKVPLWLEEGLSEVFSTVRAGPGGSTIGGDLPARSQVLRREPWIPLRQILDATTPSGDPFYAETWALADLLVFAPEYRARLGRLMAALNAEIPGTRALPEAFGKPLDTIEREVKARRQTVRYQTLPMGKPTAVTVDAAGISGFATRWMLADLAAAMGDTDRAMAAYRELEREAPANPDLAALMGTIAFQKGDQQTARTEWKKALDLGARDADVCFRYAALSVPPDEARRALERAVALRPDFDDARYSLALVLKNSGEANAAVAQLRAIRNLPPQRAWHYWTAMADALIQLDRREEAREAARQAVEFATTTAEREHAGELSYVAATDVVARMDGDRLVTTRIPHGAANWNPFVEPGDRLVKVEGRLRQVECGEAIRLVVETDRGVLTLSVPDLRRVVMRNADGEIVCGPQSGLVSLEYAIVGEDGKTGVLRGLEFR